MTASLPSPVSVTLPSGEEILLRPLRPDDGDRFGVYLGALSEHTRSLWAPHPFDPATAAAICAALNHAEILRVVATTGRGDSERIVAYFLLKRGFHESDRRRYEALGIPLDEARGATFAPSVADDYQSRGLGNGVMRYLIAHAWDVGRTQIVLWGGVQERNERAIRFYTRWGFRKVGEFQTSLNNHDMILELNSGEARSALRAG